MIWEDLKMKRFLRSAQVLAVFAFLFVCLLSSRGVCNAFELDIIGVEDGKKYTECKFPNIRGVITAAEGETETLHLLFVLDGYLIFDDHINLTPSNTIYYPFSENAAPFMLALIKEPGNHTLQMGVDWDWTNSAWNGPYVSVSYTVKECKKNNSCTTIQSGGIYGSDGNLIETGYDEWGYNYQARMFNGYYCDAYRDAAWCQEWANDKLSMKWNDAWLSNKDCDGDGSLDRHYGFDSYIGSGAWLTNHQSGEYELDGTQCTWVYFVKIVAAPADAYTDGGVWYTPDGAEIGPVIWGDFAIVQEVTNDACAGQHGVQYHSPVGPGLGKF
jgi:hypothetical protein